MIKPKNKFEKIKNQHVEGNETIIRFILKGKKGAIQFICIDLTKVNIELSMAYKNFLPCDLGYHSKVPQYKGQEKRECDLYGECYYDGSTMNADTPLRIWLDKGEEELWKYLEAVYTARFDK